MLMMIILPLFRMNCQGNAYYFAYYYLYFHFVFCELLNGVASSSDCTASNERKMSEYGIETEVVVV
jgi:hypothetical protein